MCLYKKFLLWTYIEILIIYNVICMEWLIDWLTDWLIDWLLYGTSVRKTLLILTFVKIADVAIIKLLTGHLTAHQHIRPPVAVNNVIIITLGGTGVPLAVFHDRLSWLDIFCLSVSTWDLWFTIIHVCCHFFTCCSWLVCRKVALTTLSHICWIENSLASESMIFRLA